VGIRVANAHADALMDKAKSLTGIKETAALVRQAFDTLVRVKSGYEEEPCRMPRQPHAAGVHWQSDISRHLDLV